ncbi:hypothetical protein FGADI_8047 [Fusarium gaditjirri]|uniref:Uncharacterized protein n=1 Tax=Fusarium gaditjirri TaxID=282569 RepID=A0A8H4WTW8_9HYPO|nr:hypothetical protein FGADI_8047 [Fusarium gaditjirri]
MDGPSRLPTPRGVTDKRYSLTKATNRINAEIEDEIFQLVTDLDEHVRESQNFRWQAVSTQKAQDRVRFNYRHFLQTINIINDGMTEEDIDKEILLGGQEKITMQCNTMAKIYNASSLPHNISFVVITEAMRYATQAFQLTNAAGMTMSKVGLPGLRQLVDFNMISVPSIEVAECHHLAWCIGRIFAARPGSLSRSDNKLSNSAKKPFLTSSQSFTINLCSLLPALAPEDHQESMRTNALTTSLSLRGQKIGYADALTFYSLRRRTANDLSRKIGKSAARSSMKHDPDSRTLEKYYLLLEDTLDVSCLALDELDGKEGGGHTKEMLKADSDLAIHVLTDERARKVHGPALNALMNQMMLGDENYPALASTKELRNYKRVDQHREMSQTEYNERVHRLERSRLGELVLKKALQNLAAPEPIDVDEGPSDEPPTAEDEATCDKGEPEANEDIWYVEAAKAFMQLILSNTMSEYQNLRKNGVPCPRCQDDDTIRQEIKNKRYYDATHLYDIERSKLHLPKYKWVRQITQAFEASGKERITCPYCKQPGKESSFFHVKALVKHITHGRFGAMTDCSVRMAGEGWEKHRESKSKTFRKNLERHMP